MAQADRTHAPPGRLSSLLRIEPGEWTRFLLAFAYFFCLLGSYFMLRPIRGTVAANHNEILHLLYTGTFLSMLLLVPVFGFLVSRFRRGIFIPLSYGVFILQLLWFAWSFTGAEPGDRTQIAFYIWLSVFNLFVVSVFWSFMADIFSPGQAQRLFGSIMAGGSIGAIFGPLVTAKFVDVLGGGGVMFLAAGGLSVATLLAITLGRFEQRHGSGQGEKVIGGTILEGAVAVFRSPYLLLICLMMLCHNMTSTFLYNGLATLVDAEIPGFAERTAFFSWVDLVVQVLAFTFQFFLTSRLLTALGMPRTAIIPPLLLAAGLTLLGSSLGLVLFAAVQVAQRALNYGLLGPIKEMLFTVVDRQTKYKSKNFIDTVVYRGSDVVASWIFKGYMTLGLGVHQAAFAYLPFMAAWAFGVWRLGKRYELRRQALVELDEPSPPEEEKAG
ncbi:MAG: MFS transporter [Xanthomonadales bacterium]|jgi:AAA family ATP:ADP antiporter|nr:MFS transporter [Xanthomonadales bacterium]